MSMNSGREEGHVVYAVGTLKPMARVYAGRTVGSEVAAPPSRATHQTLVLSVASCI